MSDVVAWVNKLVDTMIQWVNNLFGFANFYSANYSKYIVYVVLIFVLSKILKVKVDIKQGGK